MYNYIYGAKAFDQTNDELKNTFIGNNITSFGKAEDNNEFFVLLTLIITISSLIAIGGVITTKKAKQKEQPISSKLIKPSIIAVVTVLINASIGFFLHAVNEYRCSRYKRGHISIALSIVYATLIIFIVFFEELLALMFPMNLIGMFLIVYILLPKMLFESLGPKDLDVLKSYVDSKGTLLTNQMVNNVDLMATIDKLINLRLVYFKDVYIAATNLVEQHLKIAWSYRYIKRKVNKLYKKQAIIA